jgi:hypothetical protein
LHPLPVLPVSPALQSLAEFLLKKIKALSGHFLRRKCSIPDKKEPG